MKLIIGLGNPGREYEKTRHNMGFIFLDRYLDIIDETVTFKEKFNGLYFKTKLFNEDIIFLKPQTFMNLSGTSVASFVSYFKIEVADIVVIYDDLDMEPGRFRLRGFGSGGGHKGMGNIIEMLKTEDIKRIRIGIGKDVFIPVVDWVLSKPSEEDQKKIDEAMMGAIKSLDCLLKYGFERASSTYNKRA